MPARRDIYLIYCAAFLRSLGIGVLGVLLGVYLYRSGFSSTAIGLVIAAGLAGAAVATLIVSLRADRLGRRRTLIVLAFLGALGGLGLAFSPGIRALLLLAFLGMVNGMGTDRTPSFALEQALIPGLVPDERRTWALSCYNLVLDSGHALGALAAGLPVALERWRGLDLAHSYHLVFLSYAALNLLAGLAFASLSPRIEVERPPTLAEVSPQTKRIVIRLAALFPWMRSAAGFSPTRWSPIGFTAGEESLGLLFFTVHLLNAASHLGAAWLARRIGLVNTMVFHASALQRVSDGSAARTFAVGVSGALPAARIAGGDGCAYAAVVHRGCRPPGRTYLRQRRHQSDPQHILGHGLVTGRILHAACRLRCPAGGERRVENRL
jgi:MFS family permease